MSSTETGLDAIDFPEVFGHVYASDNPTIEPLAVVFLFKLSSLERDKVIEKIEQGDGNPWPEDIPRKSIGQVPWRRSFSLNRNHCLNIAKDTSILIDEELLAEKKCMISHYAFNLAPTVDKDVREFAIIDLSQAYKLACSKSHKKSWFPDTLPLDQKFIPEKQPRKSLKTQDQPEGLYGQFPVFVTVPLTPELKTYLHALLACEFDTPDFVHLVNPSPENKADMDFIMDYLLSCDWHVGDFAIVDAQTIESIPKPIPVAQQEPPYSEFEPPYPSFGIVTELLIWHSARDEQLVAKDDVGYLFGRRTLQHSEEFGEWGSSVSQGMGLESWFDGSEGDWERHYWSCWLGEDGKVDSDVDVEAVVKS